ncbi:MAG: hypothetical protein JO057_01360 [Chloroflexi bacterium]|nr:hypothetical protein [Chloroflexota bacterium]
MDRFTLAIVGGVLALIGAGLVAAIVVRASAAAPDLSTPSGTVLAYASAERRGDTLAAWDLLAPAEQARLDRDRFLAQASDGDAQSVYLSTDDEHIDPDAAGASVVLVRTYPGTHLLGAPNSYTVRSPARVVRIDQHWRISVPPDANSLSLSRNESHP